MSSEPPTLFVIGPGVKVIEGVVVSNENSKLGMLYTAMVKLLIKRENCDWTHLPKLSNHPWNLFLSGAQGQHLHWKRLPMYCPDWKGLGQKPPLVNFSRGFQTLCRKAMLVTTLRKHEKFKPSSRVSEWLPRSFIISQSNQKKSEREQLVQAFHERAGRSSTNAWILKPSDGGKGERIHIMNDIVEIEAFLDSLPEGSIAYVVSEYIEQPLLLPGKRKFDWRLWVLLSHDGQAYVYKEGVFRTCSVEYSLDDLTDQFVHLSNHCIQVHSDAYGDFESTNEMFYPEFEAIVSTEVFRGELLPQAHHIISETLNSAKETLVVDPEFSGYCSFNVFGFDLMVDADNHVWLVEVNSSPAVAEGLLPDMVRDLIDLQIDPYFHQTQSSTSNGWERIASDETKL